MRRLKVDSELAALLRAFPPTIKQKLRGGLDALLQNPHEGKPLQAELSGLWSLRVGRFRIIYRWEPSFLEIIAVGPRETIYPAITERLRKLWKL